ncbi:uncharacterized protein B0T15DRAFT_500513 [Chaetomium strumarium]|uniref:Ubiquitin-like protease family profile domain-containing protein n=1 Tax=Chaetomium strumarium TaxID=1170767 RepID=A0AAJ0GZ32_9PEZI|nr:hypothetical protein B0T15DRAFT_500513 [Chaetomium strumarium]
MAGYPPISSIPGRDRTRSTKSQRTIAAGAKREPTSAGAPELQDAQKPKDRSNLDFHRIEHSFPKYGTLKGAVRMPQPSSMFLKRLAPQTHVNTLDSRPECAPQTHLSSTAHAPRGPSPPKRRKLNHKDARLRGPEEDVADAEQDARSRTERRGSQTSFAHSMSPVLSEFQSVEASTQLRSGRGHRRNRRPQANRFANTANHARWSGTLSRLESMESFDELAPAQKPPARQQRTARLISTAGPRPNASFGDPADEFILQKLAPAGSPGRAHDKKRPINDIDDHDELGEEANGRKRVKTGLRAPTEGSVKPSAPSLSRRGDLNPTKWAKKPGTDTVPTGARVQAAVCQPSLRYLEGDRPSHCILRPADGPELRVFTEDGGQAEPYHWLKITGKVKTLTYHPESNIIKIKQATDQTLSPPIGQSMVLKFATNADASWVAEWAAGNLTIEVTKEMDRDRLGLVYDRLSEAVSLAAGRTSARRLSDGVLAGAPRRVEMSPKERPALPHAVPANVRTPLRQQMQVSAQQQTPSRSQDQHSPELHPHSSRSLRTGERMGQVPRAEAPRAPVIHRWSEEHSDWEKEWEMPLIFNRATVNKEDIPRLDEGQCLNDNLIGFGLRYLFDNYARRHTDLHKRVYLHNSFFYEKLKAGRNINYDGVKSWTAKVDLLSYDYIVVPVNEHYHWWVAIICNPGKLDPDLRGTPTKTDGSSGTEVENKGDKTSSDIATVDMVDKRPVQSTHGMANEEPDLVKSDIVDLVSDNKNVSIDLTARARPKQNRKPRPTGKTYNPQDPRIITLDSLGSSHPQAVTHLKKYLLAEFKHKRNKTITDVPSQLGMRATNIPEQNNLCDCGVYLLGYIQEFVKSPDLFIETLLQRERPDWDFNPSDLRELWRDTINIEHKLYLDRQLAGKQRRSESSGAKRTPNGSAGPSYHPSRETSAATNGQKNAAGSRMDSSEPTTSTKTSTTPTNSSTDQRAAGDGATRSSTPEVATSSPQQAHRRAVSAPKIQESVETPEEESVVIIAPQDSQDPQDGGAVLPSIEAPDVEKVHKPSKEERDGEPQFIAQLPSSSTQPTTSDDEDDDHVAEVDPKSFYHQSRSTSKRGDAQSSPVRGQHRRRKKATTSPAVHTSSRFVVDGSSPQLGDDTLVVQKAELIRHSDTIDLT